jgi:hypothetical protein
MSLPIMVTRVSASGPLPMIVAPLTGYCSLPFSTQQASAGREHELAVGDVDLTTAEVDRVQALVDRGDDLRRVAIAVEHAGVGHARHRQVREGLAPTVAGRRRSWRVAR